MILLLCAGVAHAGGRKRIVVLDFEGPKAEKFHDDVVKLIKKQHTVVPAEKWSSTADELDAGTVTEKNIKKVARKLKIDGVVTGKIEKRRDEYLVHLKLRAGKSGELAGQPVDTKSESGRLDGKAQRDVKDELITSIEDLEANHGGGSDDDDVADKPAKKDKKVAKKDSDDDEDAKPAAKKDTKKVAKSDDDDDSDSKPAKKGFSKKTFDKGSDSDDDSEAKPAKKDAKKDAKKTAKADEDDDAKPAAKKDTKKVAKADDDSASSAKHDDDESPLPKGKKRAKSKDDDDADDAKKKKTAKKDDDDSGGDQEATADSDAGEPSDLATQLSPSERAIDFGAGMSFTARRMSWDSKSTLSGSQIPPNYTQSVPVAGAVFDVTVFPLAYGHKRHDYLAGVGLELLYDKVLFINSKKLYGPTGMQQVATLDTSESRFALAGVFRYPLGKGANAAVVGGKLAYQSQGFSVAQTTPDGKATDIPNVSYGIIEPSVFLRYPAMPKLIVDVDAGYMLVTGAGNKAGPLAVGMGVGANGDIGSTTGYGTPSASGFELAAGAEYALTPRIFARGMLRIESIGMSFKSDPNTTANNRDSDNTSQDVMGAKDLYFGGYAIVGFLY